MAEYIIYNAEEGFLLYEYPQYGGEEMFVDVFPTYEEAEKYAEEKLI